MAGEAKSNAFMLGTATVMVGPLADLMALNDAHSIGLVKNITVKTTPGFTDLTQGVKNSLVYSVMTSNEAGVSGEMYEYTGRNLSYGAGLDGSAVTPAPVATTVSAAYAAPVNPATEGLTSLSVLAAGTIAAGDYIFIQPVGTENVIVRKVASVASNVLTLDRGLPIAVAIGATVRKVNVIALGSTADQPYLSAKIVGVLASGETVAILLPKVRITSGLSLGFKTDNFDNMALEMKIFDLVPADPFFSMFQAVGPAQKPAKAMLLTGQ